LICVFGICFLLFEICFSHYSYDVHGNVNSLLQLIRHDGNVLAKTVDYEYDLISGKVNKVYYQKKKYDQLIHVYAYDGVMF
jgi:deoxycytidylate deaminase